MYRVSCGLLRLLVRSGLDDRELEIAVLRHQLRVLTRGGKRPRYSTADRVLLAAGEPVPPPGAVVGLRSRARDAQALAPPAREQNGPEAAPRAGTPSDRSRTAPADPSPGKGEPPVGLPADQGRAPQASGSGSPPPRSRPCCAEAAWGRRPGGSDPRGGSSCGPKPSPSCPPAPPPPTWRIGLGARRVLQQNHSRPIRRLAPRLLPVEIPPVISRSPLEKSSATRGCTSPSESRLRVAAHPAAGVLVTDRPLLTLVSSPCLTTTAGLLGRAGISPTVGRRVPFRPLNAADRRSLAAFDSGVWFDARCGRLIEYLYPTRSAA